MANHVAITGKDEIDVTTSSRVLYQDDIIGVVASDFLICQQAAHPPIGKWPAQPFGKVVINLGSIDGGITFQNRIAFA